MGQSNVKRWAYAVSKMFDEHLCFGYLEKYRLLSQLFAILEAMDLAKYNMVGSPQSVFY